MRDNFKYKLTVEDLTKMTDAITYEVMCRMIANMDKKAISGEIRKAIDEFESNQNQDEKLARLIRQEEYELVKKAILEISNGGIQNNENNNQ